MGGCRDGMTVIWRQREAAVMTLGSFGDKRMLQGWNSGRLEARGYCCGMAIAWRQENAAEMEVGPRFGGRGMLQGWNVNLGKTRMT
jgi:hypothetical protein